MDSLGILVTKHTQEQSYFTDIAIAGKKDNITIYLFLPNDVDLLTKTTKGRKFCHTTNIWVEDTFPIPPYIYDRCFYESKVAYLKCFPYVSLLKSQSDIHFLGHGLPNKWIIYNELLDDEIIKAHLPKTEVLESSNQILTLLANQTSILLKPSSGSQGKGIFILSNNQDGFTLLAKRESKPFYKTLTKKQIQHLVYKIRSHQYLIQPLLTLTDQEQRPFDLRVFLQKDKNGEWIEVGRGIRKGKLGDYTSNLGSGGQVATFESWYNSLTNEYQDAFQFSLHKILLRIPRLLESKGYQLFELGLDFGIDKNGRLWLLEANSKPGRKVIMSLYPHKKAFLAKAPIKYSLLLEKRKRLGHEL
ncbi:hypothetical protein BKP37_15725 [Anaerobacillus alkalilacustris]|uniref:ATP-grasp domain-containing protein n=1 Tax=Anaerobacillus alkalilacustris TaxID=393763 RepID=A0A1S2LG89_9BACI|nr:YheC/YheD family protein [Anaerobacillus alkalilacustris]OIJ11401.1 hypothetical protein BKP37_15725 [Anaerobacillus alkalilacustris]